MSLTGVTPLSRRSFSVSCTCVVVHGFIAKVLFSVRSSAQHAKDIEVCLLRVSDTVAHQSICGIQCSSDVVNELATGVANRESLTWQDVKPAYTPPLPLILPAGRLSHQMKVHHRTLV